MPGRCGRERADSGLLLIEGLALCDQSRTGIFVCPGIADVSAPIRGYCSLKGLPLRSEPDGAFRVPERCGRERADSGLLLIEWLALAISAGHRFPCAQVTARRSAPIRGYCSLNGLPFATSAGHRFPCARMTARRSTPIRGGYSHCYSDKCKDGNGSHRSSAGRNLRCRIRRPAVVCTRQRAGDRYDPRRAAFYGVQRFSSPSCARA